MPEMVRQLVGVSIVLATLVALLWFAKGRGWARWRSFRGAGDERIVTVLQRVPLTPQHTLHVLAVGRRRLVVTSSPGSCQLLGEVDAGAGTGSANESNFLFDAEAQRRRGC